jgi:hypothetical protein
MSCNFFSSRQQFTRFDIWKYTRRIWRVVLLSIVVSVGFLSSTPLFVMPRVTMAPFPWYNNFF